MTYEEIVGYVKKKAAKADAKKFAQAAVQIDITGEGEGAFYVAVADGKIDVQPYEYYDYNAKVVADGNDFVAFLDGKKGAEVLSVEGDAAAAEIVKSFAEKAKAEAKKAEAKPAEKKAEAKKAEPKKAAAKTAEKKEEVKKAEPAKAEVKKAEAKPVEKKAEAKKAEPKKAACAKPTAKKTPAKKK